ncbi:DGQHR domain-containing protein [Dehalogenimonas sp. 4OHTPN]|uniref:DGQHR domain-containing protein n=1 Tax=Dehalogenimonas sp. 4OHTPN TaxID=3166643 RepID=A0AAU8G971_9CHLR
MFRENGNHYKIQLIPFNQKGNTIYLAKIPADKFLGLYIVEPAEYNFNIEQSKVRSLGQDEYIKERLLYHRIDPNKRDYQRFEDPARVSKIQKYLNDNRYALFPNSVIVASELINDYLENTPSNENEIDQIINTSGNILSLFLSSPEGEHLYIPKTSKPFLVIDGQHRLAGLRESNVSQNFDIIVALLLDYPWPAVASIFYTINYTQKAVSKSVLYELAGEFSDDLEIGTVWLHQVVRILNEVEKSPFYKRVKILGKSDSDTPNASISQAFIIDYLVSTLDPWRQGALYPPIFRYYFQKSNEAKISIVTFLMRYFEAIRQLCPVAWDDPSASIISKTVGVGALIRIMHFLFVKLFIEEYQSNPTFMETLNADNLKAKLDGLQLIDFSSIGEFGGSASSGGLNKLVKALITKLPYFGSSDYDDFIFSYRNVTLKQYRAWFDRSVNNKDM